MGATFNRTAAFSEFDWVNAAREHRNAWSAAHNP
jgi:hypothetical protein